VDSFLVENAQLYADVRHEELESEEELAEDGA
jgi:hypothetical protein